MTTSTDLKHLSKPIVASYIFDWAVILISAAVGAVFSRLTGNHHVFSLLDPAISFPHKPNTVTRPTLMVVSIVAPGIIIFLVCMLFVPGTTVPRGTSSALKWRRRIWEWNTGWMGLGLSLAGAFLFTEALKNLVGKPRPDLLARCDPDLSLIGQYTVSGLGPTLPNAPIMVDYRICRNQSKLMRTDGFAAWPSGHSSFAWASMLYLTLFLSAKFAISIPYLSPRAYSASSSLAAFDIRSQHPNQKRTPLRNQAAAPPVYLLVPALVPIGTAFFISISRYTDYRHAGFDIISGSVLGSLFAWFGFRWYHLPIRTGAGWSWGARTRDRAFYTGLGISTYAGDEGWSSGKADGAPRADRESRENMIRSGADDRPAVEVVLEMEDPAPSVSSDGERKDGPQNHDV